MGGAWVISYSLTLGLSRAARRSSGWVRRALNEQRGKHRGGELGIGIKSGHDFCRFSCNIKEKKVQSLRLKKKIAKVNWNKTKSNLWGKWNSPIFVFPYLLGMLWQDYQMWGFFFSTLQKGKKKWDGRRSVLLVFFLQDIFPFLWHKQLLPSLLKSTIC